ncbi:MAG TPA: serine hydrolase domain-containing protein, partial [Pirellulales bacterium]|nr:serine hydrolase domain-containing protein [Pirellulales bacterium]
MKCTKRCFVTIFFTFALLTACRLAAAEGPAEPPAELAGFDELVIGVMKEDKVPGLAIAVVRDGQVVLSKGYGQRNVAENLPVTAQTLFAIGSVTKSFTAAGLGMLVDDGQLDWDQPVRKWLADFQLKDGIASEHMTPRDLVTHRSGLPRHDLLWYGSPLSRRELYGRLRYLEPSKEFRATFQYNNLMFMTA